MSGHVTVIAEAGVNHNGDPALALKLVDAAADAGADAVKFQTFRAEALAAAAAPKAAYQAEATGASESQLDMLRRLELSPEAHRAVAAHSRARNISFMSTPFDLESLRFLVEEMNVETIKIGSGDLTNAPLLVAAARARRGVILSTGMGTLGDVEAALGALAFGLTASMDARPTCAAFAQAFSTDAGRAALRTKITLLHCTTEYPAPIAETNLRAMATMRRAFALPVGFSDHTPGLTATIAAVALGATVIEKHLTLDRTMPGPDHAASLEPKDFALLVAAVHTTESALGNGEKKPTPGEIKNMAAARKSLFARVPIAKGEILTESNLAVLRPGIGISAMDYFDWLGKTAMRVYAPGEALDP